MMRLDDALLRSEISACTVCAPYLPLAPRPVTQFSRTSRVLIIGQAPGNKVHASGIPWSDDSGDRLRGWTGLDRDDFYDPAKVALVPMGFCFPGKAAGGDAPPRPECAPRWHRRILDLLPADRLTLLVGSYAQQAYLPKNAGESLVDRVRGYERFGPAVFPTRTHRGAVSAGRNAIPGSRRSCCPGCGPRSDAGLIATDGKFGSR